MGAAVATKLHTHLEANKRESLSIVRPALIQRCTLEEQKPSWTDSSLSSPPSVLSFLCSIYCNLSLKEKSKQGNARHMMRTEACYYCDSSRMGEAHL